MSTDFFQLQVNKRWYQLFWIFMVAWNVTLLSGYIGAQFSTVLDSRAQAFNINFTMAIIASINLLYLLVFYWIAKRASPPFAILIGAMLQGLGILYGLANTDHSYASSVYIDAWLVAIFFSGTLGIPSLAGSVFLTGLYVLLHYNFKLSVIGRPSLLLVGGSIVVGVIAYFFWQRRFVSVEEQRLSQLSGELKTNQQQAGVLIESIADGVIVVNTDGKIILMNPSAAAMTQWSINDAVGVNATFVVKLSTESGEDIEDNRNPFTVIFSQKEHITQTFQLTGKDGKKQIVSLVISPVMQSGNTNVVGAVALLRDISQERAAEQQRADFISTASHEMRTPVAAIEGYLSLALNEKVSTIDSRARGFLEKAHTSTQHLGQLFQDLLTSSKAEDGRLSNHPGVVEMGAFLQQLSDDLKFAAEKKGLFAEFLVGSATDAIDATNKDTVSAHVLKPLYYVWVDPDRIREVITNLFDNACKYTEQGKISIGLTGDNDTVQFYIRDTGAGIPAEDIPHLFQKFYRVDNSVTRTIGGTGLGLFICRKIVEMYRGRIWVESEVGKGSTFFINLPRLSAQRAQQLQTEASAMPASVNSLTKA